MDYGVYQENPEESLTFNTLLAFYSAQILLMSLCGYVAFASKEVVRPFMLAATGYFALNYGHLLAANNLSDFRTYSYETLLIGFYIWAAFLLVFALALLIYPVHFRKILFKTGIFSLVGFLLLTLEGRGSVEQLDLLVGGLLVERTWEMWTRSLTSDLLVIFAIGLVCWPFIYTCFAWIRDGNFTAVAWKNSVKTFCALILILGVVMLSIPVGMMVNKSDINEAEAFIDQIVPQLKRYYEKNGEYPRDLRALPGVMDKESPRLLKIFDYLANGYKGAYYFSRPQKFCFIFQDQGKDRAYYSLTNEREWRASHAWANLEEHHTKICDEGGPNSHESLIAGHLGVSDFDNPLEELALEADAVIRPAISQQATLQLKEKIEDFGAKDPSIYGDETQSSFDAEAIPTVDALRFAVMNGKFEEPDGFEIVTPEDEKTFRATVDAEIKSNGEPVIIVPDTGLESTNDTLEKQKNTIQSP